MRVVYYLHAYDLPTHCKMMYACTVCVPAQTICLCVLQEGRKDGGGMPNRLINHVMNEMKGGPKAFVAD